MAATATPRAPFSRGARARQRAFRHPGYVVLAGFLATIGVGTILLLLPISAADGRQTSFVDALFTATSAITTTGLDTVNGPAHWSNFGDGVIAVLIQIGGLGILTSASLFFMVVAHRIGLRRRLATQMEVRADALGGLRQLVLVILKVAVLVELIDGRPMPQGRSQIAHAATVVRQRFAQASVLFAIDQLVRGVIGAITGVVRGVLNLLPIPGARQVSGLLHAFLRVAVGLIDEVILAHAIRSRATDPWASAREALVLYGQNYRPVLKNAAWLAGIVYGLSLLGFLVMLAPAALVVYLMPGAWAAGGFVFALLFAWAVKAALLEPFAVACMMQVYFRAIEGQSPDPEWDARLEQMSGHFRKLKGRIAGGRAAPVPRQGETA